VNLQIGFNGNKHTTAGQSPFEEHLTFAIMKKKKKKEYKM
jgi:hypothetical protein